MSSIYGFDLHLPCALPQAAEALRAALQAHGLVVLSEVDLQQALAGAVETGDTGPPRRLLGLCHPVVAHGILRVDPDFGAWMPCSAVLTESPPGRTRIVVQDPRLRSGQGLRPAVRVALESTRAALLRAVADLKAPRST